MRIHYANRKNDSNILNKKFRIMDSQNPNFKGKITLIEIEKVKSNFIAHRPNGSSEVIIDDDYKIMTYFPDNENYCMTVMYDKDNKLLQWYFDIVKNTHKSDMGIPYNEDMYLDVVALPNGESYTMDEDDLKSALEKHVITREEYDDSYQSLFHVKEMIANNFNELERFTDESFDRLSKQF